MRLWGFRKRSDVIRFIQCQDFKTSASRSRCLRASRNREFHDCCCEAKGYKEQCCNWGKSFRMYLVIILLLDEDYFGFGDVHSIHKAQIGPIRRGIALFSRFNESISTCQYRSRKKVLIQLKHPLCQRWFLLFLAILFNCWQSTQNVLLLRSL